MGTRWSVALPVGLVLLLAVLAGGCRSAQPAASAAGTGWAAERVTPAPRAAADSFKSSRSYTTPAAPVRIRIPAIGVDSMLERVRRAADGTMNLPLEAAHAAWWREGPVPGQRGPAVILGHVNWRGQPAVFFRLDELRPGETVYVDRADGDTGRFEVTRVGQFPKNRFPTDLVYAPSLEPELRLITCGGSFDHVAGSYRDNVIVFAVPR